MTATCGALDAPNLPTVKAIAPNAPIGAMYTDRQLNVIRSGNLDFVFNAPRLIRRFANPLHAPLGEEARKKKPFKPGGPG